MINSKAFFNVLKILSSLTDEDLDKWEKSVGFISYRTKVREVLRLFNDNQIGDLKNWIIVNQHLFRLNDETLTLVIDNPIDQIICNEKGEYFTSDVYNVVKGNRLISIANPDEEKNQFALASEKGLP